MAAQEAFADLQQRLDHRFRETTAAAFTLAEDAVVASGIPEFDRILGGGFPRGAIGTLEGPPSSGRTALAARLLAVATRRGLGATVGIELFPPALAAAGVTRIFNLVQDLEYEPGARDACVAALAAAGTASPAFAAPKKPPAPTPSPTAGPVAAPSPTAAPEALDKAIPRLEAKLKADPNDKTAMTELAQDYYSANRPDLALALATKLIAAGQKNAQTYYLEGISNAALG
ncbi:MAG: hypothetical protein ABR591_06520, partial [Candidatus Velthaea sp.]